MKAEVKKQKAITLVALIITIIVLLILAVVAIRAVTGDGIIAHAKNARDEYEEGQRKEQGVLYYYESYLNGTAGKWIKDGNVFKKVNEDGTIMEINIGDKVAYDEGYDESNLKTSDITDSDNNKFTVEDMEWRILDIEENGTVKLISNRSTTSKLTLSGEQGWLDAETKLDTLCSELYANGTGVTARSLKVEDIDKLANMLTPEARKAVNSGYGTWWRYRYNPTVRKIQYSKSTNYNPTTKTGDWTDYTTHTNADNIFKEPGKASISGSNYQNVEGSSIEAELEYTSYSYSITSKITGKTSDNIKVSDLIYKGINKDTGAVNSSGTSQWLSSKYVNCEPYRAYFGVRCLNEQGEMRGDNPWHSYNYTRVLEYAVRPVVSFPSSILTTKVDGAWQLSM